MVLTGPECTAKTTLTLHLAGRFRVPHALEYARFDLEARGPGYDYGALLPMSLRHQSYQRGRVPPGTPLGVLDTDLLNYKIWCEVVFGRCHPGILRRIERETGHRYLLCAPDVPWEPDPLRENPADRDRLFDRHLAEINRLGRPFEIVRGLGADRFRSAEAAWARLAPRPPAGGGPGPG